MSQEAISWATNQLNICSRAKLVLLVLASLADDDKYFCSPSKRELAKFTGLPVNIIGYCLKELKTANLIKKKPRYQEVGGQTSNSYWILVNKNEVA
jgi:hypothetical protein